MKYSIQLRWDYHCWPLWLHDGQIFDNIDPATLPLSESTIERLNNWSAIPDAKLTAIGYPPDIEWTAAEAQIFEVEGRSLSQILQSELGDDYCVSYINAIDG